MEVGKLYEMFDMEVKLRVPSTAFRSNITSITEELKKPEV